MRYMISRYTKSADIQVAIVCFAHSIMCATSAAISQHSKGVQSNAPNHHWVWACLHRKILKKHLLKKDFDLLHASSVTHSSTSTSWCCLCDLEKEATDMDSKRLTSTNGVNDQSTQVWKVNDPLPPNTSAGKVNHCHKSHSQSED